MLRALMISLLLAVIASEGFSYPRIANFWAVDYTSRDYDKWAKYGLLIVGEVEKQNQEVLKKFVREVKSRNPQSIILCTVPLMNIVREYEWFKPEWLLKKPDGEFATWWADKIFLPNLMLDEAIGALVNRTKFLYEELLKEKIIDGLFYDSVVAEVTWLGEVDADLDGSADKPEEINSLWLQRQNLFFDKVREICPDMIIVANDASPGHMGHINGRLYEGLHLLDKLEIGMLDSREIINILNNWTSNAKKPTVTLAQASTPMGWQGWRIPYHETLTAGELDRAYRDFRRMRRGLATVLMTDAYYSYEFGTVYYSSSWWYAEYEAKLGKPKGPAVEIAEAPPILVLDWKAGDDHDIFLKVDDWEANKEGLVSSIFGKDRWRRVFATDHRKVRFEPGKRYHIQAEIEIIEKPKSTIQAVLRTGKGGWQNHDKGATFYDHETSTWKIDFTATPDEFDDYQFEIHLHGPAKLALKKLRVHKLNESFWKRDFENGTVYLNPLSVPIKIKPERKLKKLLDGKAPMHVLEIDDSSPDFSCSGGWEVLVDESRQYPPSYRKAAKIGAIADWKFSAPSDDMYSFYACFPGGMSLTHNAFYSLIGDNKKANAIIDQRTNDGGWIYLFDAKLQKNKSYKVRLISSGLGVTVADAIRIESKSRFNDGSVVENLVMDALDGIVLVSAD